MHIAAADFNIQWSDSALSSQIQLWECVGLKNEDRVESGVESDRGLG